MCDSGLLEFPRADDFTLFEGLTEAARLRLPVAVHAESHELTQGLSRKMAGQWRTGARDFIASRPVVAEVEAIERAARFAGEAGAKLHIVHISSGRGVVAAAAAKARGVDVSIETCAHYLFFTEEDLERLGAIAKCAPPLRDAEQHDALWKTLLDGTIDIVASDHSPAPPEMKTGPMMQAWGGIAGVQSTLAVLLEEAHFRRALQLERIATLTAATPAHRFRIAHKGTLASGNDADLVLVDLRGSYTLEAGNLQQRHPISPYIGAAFRGVVTRTVRRGETIFANGAITARTQGVLVRPL
jgi:allantoinase